MLHVQTSAPKEAILTLCKPTRENTTKMAKLTVEPQMLSGLDGVAIAPAVEGDPNENHCGSSCYQRV